MQSVQTLLKLAQLRWTGHVTRMPDKRLPKKVLYGELQEGKRSQGGQKKRYKDTPKASLKDFNIPAEYWEQAAQDRTNCVSILKDWSHHTFISCFFHILRARKQSSSQESKSSICSCIPNIFPFPFAKFYI